MSDSEDQPTENRRIAVTDERLSPGTRSAITADLQRALGSDTADVPTDRPHVESGEHPLDSGPVLNATNQRLLILVLSGGGFIGLLIAILAHAGWWFLPIVYLLTLALALGIVRTVLVMTAVRDHPSATTAAAMQEDGILNPDEYYSDLVREYEAPSEDGDSEDRTVHSHEQPGRAGAEQENAMTPTSTPSKAVGP